MRGNDPHDGGAHHLAWAILSGRGSGSGQESLPRWIYTRVTGAPDDDLLKVIESSQARSVM
ncbi:hypothetical protein QR78_16725 [Methylobacterium indicum]|uniref:Transposase IS66 C-terminal domain-containing protein n=1 Tax=Methylobacterium indicum TaxID=1775910 RepID=A0ABR5H881_9HYPH|nr:hypothetical protein QR78_16725 [Methylobacterium indicum]KMO20732.1 hypothetical protein QR79_17690 [Methylobacterium indicum]